MSRNAESAAEVWGRTIRPEIGDLTIEAAQDLLRLRFAEVDAERVQLLSRKANAGQLTSAEEDELDHYLSIGRALEFLKAKARQSLREKSSAV